MFPPTRKLKTIENCINKIGFSVDKIKTSEYLSEWKYAVIDQGKELVGWYYDGNANIYNGKLPVIIYGDHTNVVKYIDFPFICGADGVKVFCFNNDCDAKYFYYALIYFRPETQWYRRHYSLLKEIEFPLPPLQVQQDIVKILDQANIYISESKKAIQSQIDELDKMWQSVLSDIFENINWEKTTVWNILDFNYWKWLDKSERYQNSPNPVYWANWIIDYTDKFVYDWDSIIVWRKWSVWALNKVNGKFWPTDVTYYITLKKNWDMNFIYYLLCTFNLPSYAQWVKPWLNRNSIYIIDVNYPPLSEQQKIVSYLDDLSQNISNLKTLYKSQLAHYDELWASVLDQAFRGELVR